MKELILIRHAKSSWEFDVSDLERPLKSRGHKDIRLVANEFSRYNFKPDAIFSSPARRAKQTAKLFLETGIKRDLKLQKVDKLYDFSGNSVVEFVKSLPIHYEKVIIFGHNHAFTSISNIFGSRYINNVPTSGLVHLRFDINDWGDLKKGETITTLFPRDLK